MTRNPMEAIAAALLVSGKGILAADESTSTIGKRFKTLNIPSTEDTRRAYREMLVTAPKLNEFISGVILFDETVRQKTKNGISMVEVLTKQGIIPGIKVDKGTAALACFNGEKITQGLDGLRERLIEYRELGARFTKWRAVIAIGDDKPTHTCIKANAQTLALFAAVSQEAGLVPIVEPEVLMDGSHTIARCDEIMRITLQTVFDSLSDHRVVFEQMLLKTGMVLPGAECPEQMDVGVIAEMTLRCLRRTVSAAVPGIVFLSGGQSDQDATQRLNAICAVGDSPWKLSFSFGRALQSPALKMWKGADEKALPAQAALQQRARCNSFALQGKYSGEMEGASGCIPS